MPRTLLCLLALFLSTALNAAEITITGPTKPINPGRMVRLIINGLTDVELRGSKADVVIPEGIKKEDVDLFAGKTWDDRPYIDFMSQVPGKFLITIDSNAFTRKLDDGLESAESAQIDPDLLSELRIVVVKISDKYQAKSGSALVEVAGTIPFPPGPGPGPGPIPPTSGLVWTIVIRTVDTMTADQSQVLSDLRQWSDQQPADKVSHLEFSPLAEDPSGARDAKVAGWVARMPATAKQPYVFISQRGTDGKNVIHWQGELPATAEAVIAKIKELVR